MNFTVSWKNLTDSGYFAYVTSANTTLANETCQVTTQGWISLNLTPLLLCSAIFVTHLFNLVVFCCWRNKEPFVLYHISLTVTSFLIGVTGSVSPLSHLTGRTWDTETIVLNKLAVAAFALINRMTVVNTLFISVDRWLSVEFAVKYRNLISRRKVLAAIAGIYILSILITLPGLVILRNGISVSCNKPAFFNMQGQVLTGEQSFFASLTKGPFLLPVIFVFQLRILSIAITIKLRRLRSRGIQPMQHRESTAAGSSSRGKHFDRLMEVPMVARIVWGNLLPSMTVVIGVVIANVPYGVLEYTGINKRASIVLIKMQNYLFGGQHLFGVFVYIVFFPQFRATAKRLCRKVFWVTGRAAGIT